MAWLMRNSLRVAALARQCSRVTVFPQRAYSEMAFTFASPTDVFYNETNVKQVDVPSFSGNFGILPNHVPSLAVLKPGVVTVLEEDGSNKKFFVSSGSITINDNVSVQVLAEEAHPLDRLDVQAIREGIAKAQQEVNAAASEKSKAEALIALECYESLQKAMEAN